MTALIRRTAALYQVTEVSAARALGLAHRPPIGGPGALDLLGLSTAQAADLSSTTGIPVRRLHSLTLPRAWPALSRVVGAVRNDLSGRRWETRGLYRNQSAACVTCLAEDHTSFPLRWRIAVLPMCDVHQAYLTGTCLTCGQPPGRAVQLKKAERHICAPRMCHYPAPPSPDSRVAAAQRTVEQLLYDGDESALTTFLDYAWLLRIRVMYDGPRRVRQASPVDMGSIIVKALQWASCATPAEVCADEEFQSAIALRRKERPFAGPGLTQAARLLNTSKVAARCQPVNASPAAQLVGRPDYLPTELHLKWTADLMHDGWPAGRTPSFIAARRVAAQAVAPGPEPTRFEQDGRMNPTKMAAQVTSRLEELGRREHWETAVARAAEDLKSGEWLFGADDQDISAFLRCLRPTAGMPYPDDAAVVWFLREHRCVRPCNVVSWPIDRFGAAVLAERRARVKDFYGPWDQVEGQLRAAAQHADRASRRRHAAA